MAGKTVYDVLEGRFGASAEAIRSAYERMSAQLDPRKPENAGNPNAKFLHDSVKEAFLTLGNPALRTQYDKKLAMRTQQQPAVEYTEASETFWTIPKLATLVLVVIIAGGFYWKHQREVARLAAEQAIAAAKAKEAEEQAKAEAEAQRAEIAKQQLNAAQDAQQRRERDVALRQYSFDQKFNAVSEQIANQRQAQQERSADQQRKREEQQATAAARAQAAKDKAEL